MSGAKGINRRLAVRVTESLKKRFWSRVDILSEGECWPWKAAMRNGYGAIKHDGSVISSHRLAFILSFGEPSEDLVVGHKCDNRACCNPSHLEAISPGKNNRDARGRCKFHMARGEDCYNAVLSDSQVDEIIRIRKSENIGHVRIANRLGINPNTVKGVLQGKTWRHKTVAAGIVKAKESDITSK